MIAAEHDPLRPVVDLLEGDGAADDREGDHHEVEDRIARSRPAVPAEAPGEPPPAGCRPDSSAIGGVIAVSVAHLMATVRLDLAYHGARFAGWAAQPGERTVQDELESALEQVLGVRPTLTVAGRTDAGVHAWGQVASFDAEGEPPRALARALNALTGDDLTVWSAAEPPRASTPAATPARGPTATACCRRPSQSPFERGLCAVLAPPDLSGPARALRRGAASADTTSPPSRPPGPATCTSSGT